MGASSTSTATQPNLFVIEIDGKQHYTEQGIAYDTERTQVLQEYGLKVLRYTNQQLEDNFQEVCWDIERNL